MKLLLLNGPNLNLLGQREPQVYGTQTLAELEAVVMAYGAAHGAELTCNQSNHEGALIDWIQDAPHRADGLIFNPGAYAHYSYALRDAIAAVAPFPVVEVHLSDISAREEFRHTSVTAPVCAAVFAGGGQQSYLDAVDYLLALTGEHSHA
ncbi:MAG: type II 3-dehydroquinate dehydratase [Coriobacteriia bacterium]|nr:type II 3-dehydroquinate dehydratase [Coriobacteriia bacterium]